MANRFWVGGTATWDGTAGTKWATTSGGAGGAAVPTAADDVFFDAASGAAVVTLGSGTRLCRSLDCTGFTGTLTGAGQLNIGTTTVPASNVAVKLVAGMAWSVTGQMIYLSSSATQVTITTAGKSMPNQVFNGNGGDWLLTDSFTPVNALTTVITITRGTFNDGGQTVSAGQLVSAGALTRAGTISGSWTLGSGTPVNLSGTGATFTMTGSTFTFTTTGQFPNFNGNGMTFGNIVWGAVSPGLWTITGANTYASWTFTPSTGATGGALVIPAGLTQTVTGAVTMTGPSHQMRPVVKSDTEGSPATLSAGSVVLNSVDFRDIIAAGAAAPFSGILIGDDLGNTNITMEPAGTQYLVGTGTRNWDSATWASTSGGVAGTGRPPLPQDTAVIDSNSGTGTVSYRQRTLCRHLDASTASITTLRNGLAVNHGWSINGNVALKAGLVFGFALTRGTFPANWLLLRGRGSQTITTNGCVWGNAAASGVTQGTAVWSAGGTYALVDDLSIDQAFYLQGGTLDLNDQDLLAEGGSATQVMLNQTVLPATLLMGSGTVHVSNSAQFGYLAGSATVTPETSTVNLRGNGTFQASNLTWGALSVSGTGNVVTHSGATVTAFSAAAGSAVTITASQTLSVSSISFSGTMGNEVVLRSSIPGTRANLNTAGVVSVTWGNIQDSDAGGASAPFHSVGGTNSGNNLDWTWGFQLSFDDSEDLTDSLSLGRGSQVEDDLDGSDVVVATPSVVVIDEEGSTDTTSYEIGATLSDLLDETDSLSSLLSTFLSDTSTLTDLLATAANLTVSDDSMVLSDALAVAARVVLNDLLGILDELDIVEIHGIRGCIVVLLTADEAALSFDSPTAIIEFDSSSVSINLEEC